MSIRTANQLHVLCHWRHAHSTLRKYNASPEAMMKLASIFQEVHKAMTEKVTKLNRLETRLLMVSASAATNERGSWRGQPCPCATCPDAFNRVRVWATSPDAFNRVRVLDAFNRVRAPHVLNVSGEVLCSNYVYVIHMRNRKRSICSAIYVRVLIAYML